MKVAYLCHRIPYPPNKGEKIRAFYQLRALSALHDVDLFTLVDDPADLQHTAVLQQYCRNLEVARIHRRVQKLRSLPYLITDAPLTLQYFRSKRLASSLRAALQKQSYDRIFVYCSAMFPYVEHVTNTPVVTDLVDVDSDKWKQYGVHAKFPMKAIYRREGNLLEHYERKVCGQSASVMVTTDREAELVRGICPDANVHVVPIGVDTAYFDRDKAALPAGPTIVFTGDMSYFPNEQAVTFFADQVFPIVRDAVPGTRFLVVGRNPGRAVLRLQSVPGIEVTGFVPDVRPYLAQAQVAVAPFLIAAGIQNKVLEAMAFSTPVVATPRATQGLKPGVASHIETADTPAGLADKIVPYLRDAELFRRTGSEARRRVALGYDWDTTLSQVAAIVEKPTTRMQSGQSHASATSKV